MIVVEALSNQVPFDYRIIASLDAFVIWSVAKPMRETVYAPRVMQLEGVSSQRGPYGEQEWNFKASVHDPGGNYNHAQKIQRNIETPLESNHWVPEEIAAVQIFAFFDNVLVLLQHQPSHVSEEHSSCSRMWVSVRIRVLMVESAIIMTVVSKRSKWLRANGGHPNMRVPLVK